MNCDCKNIFIRSKFGILDGVKWYAIMVVKTVRDSKFELINLFFIAIMKDDDYWDLY